MIKYFYFLILFNLLSLLLQKEIKEDVTPIEASIYYIKTTGKYKVVEGKIDKMAAAWGTYTPSY